MSVQFRRLRHPSARTVTLKCQRWIGKAVLTDINEAGARVVGNYDVDNGRRVTVVVGAECFSAMVRWIDRGRCGIAFEPKLSPTALARLRFGENTGPCLTPRFDSSRLRVMR